MVYGEEMLVDEGRVVGRRAEAQGVKVEWVEFEAMPHCFAMVLDGGWHKGSRVCFERWAGFCTRAVEARVQEARGVFVEARSLEEREVRVGGEGGKEWGYEEVVGMMREQRGKRERGEDGEAKLMPRL